MKDSVDLKNKVTYYDRICDCYKLKPDVNSNIIQRLGKFESIFESISIVLKGDSSNEDKIKLIGDFINLEGSENDYN